MDTLRSHWMTALTLLAAALLLATGVGMIVTGGDLSEAGVRIFGVVSVTAAAAILWGLHGLRNGRAVSRSRYLVVAGVAWFGLSYWWLILIPPVIALVVLYAGVYRRGLERELRPSSDHRIRTTA